MEQTNPYIGNQQKTLLRSKIRELLTKRQDPNYVRSYLYEVEGLDLNTIDTELNTIQSLSDPNYQQEQASEYGSAKIGGKDYQFKSLQEALAYQEFDQKQQKEKQTMKAENEMKKSYLQSLNEKLLMAGDILSDEQGLKSSAGAIQFQVPFTKTKQRYIGNVEALLDIQTLDQLIEAKAKGATFGALSNEELRMLRSTASKVGQWAKKDKDDRVVGYDIDEESLKKEIERLTTGWERVRGEVQASILPEETEEIPQETKPAPRVLRTDEDALLLLQENPDDPRVPEVREILQRKGYEIPRPATETGMEETTPQKKSFFSNMGEDITKRFKNVFKIIGGKSIRTGEDLDIGAEEKFFQSLGQVAGLAGDTIGNALGAGFNAVDEASGGKFSSQLQEIAQSEAGKAGLQALSQGVESYDEWARENPRMSQNIEALGNILSVVPITKGGQLGFQGVKRGVGVAGDVAEMGVRTGKEALETTGEALGKVGAKIGEVPLVSGGVRATEEMASRVPRFFQQRGDELKDAAKRAEYINQAPVYQQKALKDAFNAELDEKLIFSASQADEPTKSIQREMVKMADNGKNSGVLAGKVAEEQFDLVQSKVKEIGTRIGEMEKALPNKTIDIKNSISEFSKALEANEISIVKGKIVAPNLTKAQKSALQELVSLMKERGTKLTPTQIHKFDQTLSTLQRESRMEKVADIYLNVNGENKNLYSLIRDAYRNELDKISSFRDVNAEYRKYLTLQNDLENTIFKAGGKVDSIDKDYAEFAKTNMRRIFGEAQSSETYREITNLLDSTARQLGYEGADPANLVEFAESLRKLYPETIPKTGFQGGIATGVGTVNGGSSGVLQAADAIMSAGKAKQRDQVKALKALLGDDLPKKKAEAINDELITIYRGQNEAEFSLEPRKGKMHNMSGTSFAKRKETAEMYSLSGRGLNPTVIEGTIPKSKIMTFDEFSPKMKERFKKEIDQMDDDDILSGEFIENLMDEAVSIAKALGKEAIDMDGFTRGLVDEIRVIDSAKSFKLTSKTDRSDLLEKFETKFKPEERTNLIKKEGDAVAGKAGDITSSIKQAKSSGKSFDEWVKGQGNVKSFRAEVYRGEVVGAKNKNIGEFYTIEKDRAELYKNFKAKKTGKPAQVIKEIVELDRPLRLPEEHLDAFEKLQNEIPELKNVLKSIYSDETGEITDAAIVKGEKILQDYAVKNRYDGIVFGDGSIIIKTRSKLKAEWDKIKL